MRWAAQVADDVVDLVLTDPSDGAEADAGGRPAQPRVSVVVPTRNEARNLPYVLSRLPEGLHEVILVDGGSVDGTVEVAREVLPGIRVVHQTRRGKGNALACGYEAVTGDVVVMLDADGSADPGEIPAFVAALVAGADVAKGTRFGHGGRSEDITRIRALGNHGLNLAVRLLFGLRHSDLCYGYVAFWADMLPALDLPATVDPALRPGASVNGDGFEIETLLTVRFAAADAVFAEVGSIEYPRIHGVSNLRAVSDGLRVLRTILTERRRVAARRSQAPARAARTEPGSRHGARARAGRLSG
jgi:glycosyltransferase involved in cell wall biosynthesis